MGEAPAPPPPDAPGATRGLNARLQAAPCGKLLAKIPWDGPPLDPDVIEARDMLAWLR
jgi:hypothetical protein